jgi:hypothetical protein
MIIRNYAFVDGDHKRVSLDWVDIAQPNDQDAYGYIECPLIELDEQYHNGRAHEYGYKSDYYVSVLEVDSWQKWDFEKVGKKVVHKGSTKEHRKSDNNVFIEIVGRVSILVYFDLPHHLILTIIIYLKCLRLMPNT